jgi:ABC-type transport system involved in multi-copper enzyme maturation permease subunit
MTDRLSSLLGGPVLQREYLRSTRSILSKVLAIIYVAWLLIHSYGFSLNREGPSLDPPFPPSNLFAPSPPARSGTRTPYELAPGLTRNRVQHIALTEDSVRYVSFLLYQQLLLLLLVTPMFTAGAIVYEKEKDTLQALFATALTAREIAIGKLLGRLLALARCAAAIVPPLIFAAVLAEIPVVRVLLALLQAGVLASALAAGCLLVSLRTRRTSDAILGSYSALIVIYLIGQIAAGDVSLPATFNAVDILDQLLRRNEDLQLYRFLVHLACWMAAATTCMAIVMVRLRSVSLGMM